MHSSAGSVWEHALAVLALVWLRTFRVKSKAGRRPETRTSPLGGIHREPFQDQRKNSLIPRSPADSQLNHFIHIQNWSCASYSIHPRIWITATHIRNAVILNLQCVETSFGVVHSGPIYTTFSSEKKILLQDIGGYSHWKYNFLKMTQEILRTKILIWNLDPSIMTGHKAICWYNVQLPLQISRLAVWSLMSACPWAEHCLITTAGFKHATSSNHLWTCDRWAGPNQIKTKDEGLFLAQR